MTNEDYRKCKTCRFCIHSSDIWACSLTSSSMGGDGTCARYRPGCCENCSHIILGSGSVCSVTGTETDILSVCSSYDPCGRHSRP
ncbi:MAG: hypothetical protein LBS92_05015 [Candidatus Methanoplasma sp.]|nr:hypothetical protein [Candidatus Methanoplasma sp.]